MRRPNSQRLAATLLVLLLAIPAVATAHRASDALLWLSPQTDGYALRWDVAIRDLETVLALDRNWDAQVSWGEMRAAQDAVMAYAVRRLAVASDRACTLRPAALAVAQYPDGGYAVVNLDAVGCAPTGPVTVTYDALFDVDPGHRGLLTLTRDGGSAAAVAAPGAEVVAFAADADPLASFAAFVREGVWHVWIGFDHVLFLLSLLLPCVLPLARDQQTSLRESTWAVAGVVTAFTIGHSITLGLAATGLVALPGWLVESVIALSVSLAALNNLRPVVTRRRWLLAAVFGLIHGFGFAGVLGELARDGQGLLVTLAGFNVGVELGQLAIVAVVMPLAWMIRETWVYRQAIVRGGSMAVALLGMLWAFERAVT